MARQAGHRPDPRSPVGAPGTTLGIVASERLTSEFEAIGPALERLSDAAAAACPRLGAGMLAEDLRLCLAEVLNNCVEHAYAGQPGHPIRLSLAIGGDPPRLVATIADRGCSPPSDLLEAGQATCPPPDALAEGGWGWPMICVLTSSRRLDRVSGWNRLTLEFDLD